MKTNLVLVSCAALAASPLAHSAAILSPDDFIIAVDNKRDRPGTVNPGNEDQYKLFDGSNDTKLFSNGRAFSGVIVTPPNTTTVKSISFATANDSSERDPVKYQLYGTNSAVHSTHNSDGLGESWTLISSGSTGIAASIDPATGRKTTAGLIPVSNDTAYSSYKIVFPELRSAGNAANAGLTPNGMQLSEIRLFTDTAGTSPVFSSPPTTGVIAIDQTDSFYPVAEAPKYAIDGNKTGSKYLNFGREGSGFIVTPGVGASIVQSFQITTANDAPNRDPAKYEIYGTNDSILSLDNSAGDAENWFLISSGSLALPDERGADGDMVNFGNNLAFTSYKILFPEVKGEDNSMQIGEIQFFGVIPEPATASLLALATLPLFRRRRS